MISPKSVTHSIFIKEFCNAGFTSIAYHLVREMPPGDYFLESLAYSHLIRGLCREKKGLVKALQVHDDMKYKQMVPCADALVEIIPFLLQAGRFTGASLLKDAILGDHPDMQRRIEFALINSYCMANVLRDAARLFHVLFNKTAPVTEACDMMLRAIDHLSDYKNAEELLRVMIREDAPLSVSSFRMLARLMCCRGGVRHMLSLKDILLRESMSNDHIVIYNVMIFSAFSSGNTSLVEKILDEMHERELVLTDALYDFLVHGFYRCKDMSRAGHYLSVMFAKKMRLSSRSLRRMIYCLNDSAEIGEILQELDSHGWIYGSTVQKLELSAFGHCSQVRSALR